MSRKQRYRRRLCILLVVSLILIGGFYYYKLREVIPDHITLETGSSFFLQFQKEPNAFFQEEVVQTVGGGAVKLPKNAVQVEVDNQAGFNSQDVGTYTVEYKLLGILELKSVQVDVVEEQEVYPGGTPVGIYVETDGLMVIGSGGVTAIDGRTYEPAKNILQSGDYITSINGKNVTTKEEFIQCVNEEGRNPVILEIVRNGETTKVKVNPVQTGQEEYRLGVWIRDNTQGVGMLTFVKKDGTFGALGHGITDVDTSLLMKIKKGRILNTDIISIVKGKDGAPGELVGMIDYQTKNRIGEVSDNTVKGIFGKIDETALENYAAEPLKIGFKQDMRTGPARIRSCVDGEIKEYDINILEINVNSREQNKCFLMEITDPELLEKTGGIVQGMSGSPVIQDGKLVGAVTHVLVQDSTRGYGIFIEEMLKECQ